MVFAVIDNHAAAIGEYAPVHEDAADRAFDVFDFFTALVACLVDIVQMLAIGIETVRDCAFKQAVYFSRVKEQSETVFAALDQKWTVNVEIDGLEWLLAMGTLPVGWFPDNCV